MTTQHIFLKQYHWTLLILYNVIYADVPIVRKHLMSMRCHGRPFNDACALLSSNLPNLGLTYTNISLHHSLVVIGYTSSSPQFLNTLSHELMHATIHISEFYSIPLDSEPPCYLLGLLTEICYPNVIRYIKYHGKVK